MNDAVETRLENQYWGLVGTLLWSVFILIVFVFAQFCALLLYVYVALDLPLTDLELLLVELGLETHGTVLYLSTFASMILGSLAILLAIRLKRQSNIRNYLGLVWPSSRHIFKWLGILLLLVLVSDGLTTFLNKPLVPDFLKDTMGTTNSVLLLAIAIIIAAPVFEELFFRGFLFAGLINSIVGEVGAITITSALWALIHLQYDFYGVATIFVFGIVLGFARIQSNSIILPMLMHALANLIATMQVLLLFG